MARMPRTASGAIVTLVVTCCPAIGADRADPPRQQLQSGTPLVVIRKAFTTTDKDRLPNDFAPASDQRPDGTAGFDPERVSISFADDPEPHALRPQIREPGPIDHAVTPATALKPPEVQLPAEAPSGRPDRRTLPTHGPHQAAAPSLLPVERGERAAPEMRSFTTLGGGLAIAVGLFLLLVWACRKAMPRSATRLPLEAVEVLGKAALTAKQSIHLVRVGNKLVLLSLSPGGVEALTELTDATQVEQVLAACQRRGVHSATGEFRQVLTQYHTSAPPGPVADRTPDAAATPTTTQAPSFSLWENRHA